MIEVRTYEELDSWLSANYDFEDGSIPEIVLDPLSITVGWTEGGYKAYSQQVLHAFKITPINVIEWVCYDIPSSEHCIESVDNVKVEKGVSIKVPYPLIQLTAEAFQISGPELIHSVVEPRLNKHHFSFDAKLSQIPTPSFWIEQFKNAGFDIVFRYYKGQEKKDVPYPDYTGYFFQLKDFLKDSDGGIFIGGVSAKDLKVTMHFSCKDERLQDVWICLAKIISIFPDVVIQCGNMELSGEEWITLYK